MEFTVENIIEYQKQILDHNRFSWILPYYWDGSTMVYQETSVISIDTYLSKRRTYNEIKELLKGCQKIIELCRDSLLDAERIVWDLQDCYWDGDSILGIYLPDRNHWIEEEVIYHRVTFMAIRNMLIHAWYDEELILFLHKIHRLAAQKEWEALKAELDTENIKKTETDSQYESTNANLFREWDTLQDEKMGKKHRKKLSLPFG